MKINEKIELLKFAIKLNLIKVFIIYFFFHMEYINDLVIGSINIGVWVFLEI